MGYLQLDTTIAAHKKAVISLWFRIPAASFTTAGGQTPDSTVPFAQKIPLLCWGKRKHRVEYDLASVNVLNWNSGGSAATLMEDSWSNPHDTDDQGPSYIAINCSAGTPFLEIHIQTDDTPTIVGHSYSATSADGWSVGDIANPYGADPTSYAEGSGYLNGGSWTGICNNIIDTSFVLAASPAQFYLSKFGVAADQWHHVIISYDITNGAATHQVAYPTAFPVNTGSQTNSSSKMWLSLDDVNIKMTAASASVIGGGDNDVITQEAVDIADQSHALRTYDNLFTSTATYNLSGPTVGLGAVGVPASSTYASNILKVETCELQIFTGVKLDTTVEFNRRAFITSARTPENPSTAQTLLGQAPDILLHGSNNWIAGLNTGSGSSFAGTGTVTAYTPGPNA